MDPEGAQFESAYDSETDATDGQHGTCMFSNAFGPSFGVSKKAAVTVVCLPKTLKGLSEEDPSRVSVFRHRVLTDALNLVLEDIEERKNKYRAVISLSAWLLKIFK